MAIIKIICHFLLNLEINNAVGKPISKDKSAVAVAIKMEVKITFKNVGRNQIREHPTIRVYCGIDY